MHVTSEEISRNVFFPSSHFKDAVLCSHFALQTMTHRCKYCSDFASFELFLYIMSITDQNSRCQLVISYVEVQIVNKAFVYTLRILQHYAL